MRFGKMARDKQAEFRKTLGDAAQLPSDDVGIRNHHLLALGHEDENLIPEIREGDEAKRFFASRCIKWWKSSRSGDGPGDGPTRNLASSQVCCVNFLLPLAKNQAALIALLKAMDADVVGVVPIVDGQGHSSLVEFEWVGHDGPLEGGPTTRGANQTSVDALIVAQTARGNRAYVIEWKYCEEYLKPDDKGAGTRGDTRRSRYTEKYQRPDSSFNQKAGLDDFLFEPFYQIMRLRLLGDRMVREKATPTLPVVEAKVVVVCPEANEDYRVAVPEVPLARLFPELRTVEAVVKATLRDPAGFAVVGQEHLVASLRNSPVAGGVGRWLRYHAERYGW